jgi:2'-5' RNA ligase
MEEAQGEKVRTFISIEITEDIRKKLETLTKELDQYGAKPVAKENMHITLFFLGDISNTTLEETKGILAELSCSKFYVSVRGIGTFSSKMSSVIFANVAEGKDAIGSIYKTLFKKLKTINVKIDSRDYHPHITIARTRHKCDKRQLLEFIDRNSGIEFGRFLCGEIKIKSSILTNDGPIYSDLYTKALD